MMTCHAGIFAGQKIQRSMVVVCAISLVLLSCAPAPALDERRSAPGIDGSAAPRTLRVATVKEPTEGVAVFPGGGTVWGQFLFMFHAGLTVYDAQETLQPRIARKLPTIADGDWQLFPDGQMAVTWKLRDDVRWHDGAPLVAQDFVLGMRIVKDDELPISRSRGIQFISELLAPDPQTVVVRWRQPFILANAAGPADQPAVPDHLVGRLHEQSTADAFTNSPYWTTQFVGLGPYRVGEWLSGSYTEAIAFDSYFLGRPRIDRVVLHYFNDVNALVVNLLSGAVDMVFVGSLAREQVMTIKNSWDASGEGSVILVPSSVRFLQLQNRDPDLPWVKDVRVRQALVHATDRQTLADVLHYGLSTPADVLLRQDDPVYRLVEQRGIASYPYDVARAERLLADAGWTRGPGGQLLGSSGQPLSVQIRLTEIEPDSSQEALAIADIWKRAGLDASAHITAESRAVRDEVRARAQVLPQNVEFEPFSLSAFTSAAIPNERNGWRGRNYSGYSNPTFDRLYTDYLTTLDLAARQSLQADLMKMAADEVVFIPLYYTFGTLAMPVRKGVRGPGFVAPIEPVSTWNIHTWEMD